MLPFIFLQKEIFFSKITKFGKLNKFKICAISHFSLSVRNRDGSSKTIKDEPLIMADKNSSFN